MEPWERIEAKYHHEDGAWWGEVVGWSAAYAAADTLEECRERMRELIPYGIDERLAGMARSLLFVRWFPSPHFVMDCDAAESFTIDPDAPSSHPLYG